MANGLTPRVFEAREASEVAHLVADHDPETPRTVSLTPADEAAADAGVLALVERLHSLPKSIRSALQRAGDSAAYLSDDRLQGLAELIQNADDLGASDAVVAIDASSSQLLFSHNGAALTLHDVWALAIPWLSLKVADEAKLGRFGIGLKTLHSLSDVLDVHQGHFHVRFSSNTIQPLDGHIGWPRVDSSWTTFAIPFTRAAISTNDVEKWLKYWDDAGLVFLRHLRSVRLDDEAGNEIARLHLELGPEELLPLAGDRTARRRVSAADGREWLIYTRSARTPEGVERAGKALGSRTPVAIAFALFEGDTGHIHVGLPVRRTSLPFRMLAQFDPQPSRRDIADTDWNLALVPLLSDLWRDAALDAFLQAPAHSWATVPTTAEFDADDRTTGRLRAGFAEHLLQRARIEFAEALTFESEGTTYRLSDLAYEADELTSLLSADDVILIAGTRGFLAAEARSEGDRWRDVLDDLWDIGAMTPTMVSVQAASTLLGDEQRTPQFVAQLLAIAVNAGMSAALESRACLVLEDGSRVTPSSRPGLAVLLPADPDPDPLWELLRVGARLHPTFIDQAGWTVIRDWLQQKRWLRASATSADALLVLAGAGTAGTMLKTPLTDAQVDGLRRALEAIPDTERPGLGLGLGQAVQVDAVTYDRSGERKRVQARPCDAYFIEREVNTWFVAAGKTHGLTWIDRRYSEKFRRDGGGIGAQRLFRLLGAEVAPRIKSHPANQFRLSNYSPGVPDSAPGSPLRRREALRQAKATFTLRDWTSPDLEAVLSSIAKEKDAAQQVRRAGAVLGTLARAWDRLGDHATVSAARPYYSWENKGIVEAWWVSSTASIAWLPSENGTATAPGQLRIKSPATVALYGDNPRRYLSPALEIEAYREVLASIGVAGDPTASELILKLEAVRANTNLTPEAAEDLAAPLYQALAAQVRGNRLGGQPAGPARDAFGRGEGLIATRSGWRRPSVVLAGPPIFGRMRDFVPSVSGTDSLWTLLGIHLPSAHDAQRVLGQLARKKSLTPAEKLVMLEALRVLAGAPESEVGRPRKAAVWVGDRWERKRPVYATHNELIVEALKDRVPIWSPGGSLAQLDSLIGAFRLTLLDASHGDVIDADSAAYDPNLTQVFSGAIANLRADLARSDPKAEQSLRVSWDELAALSVRQSPELRVRLLEPNGGLDETVPVNAWLDLAAGAFFVADEAAIWSPSAGAYAIASVFDSDARRVAHDWIAAWTIALDGHREEEITTAARLDAEWKKKRDERSEELLRKLAEQGKDRRSTPEDTSQTKRVKAPAASEASPAKPTRMLVDPDNLTLRNEDGEIVGGGTGRASFTFMKSTSPVSGPRDPDPSKPKKPSEGGRPTKNYTDSERESVGLALVRRILGGDEQQIIDIRHQRHVGADAIDDLENFFELKVYAGPIPEMISLTNSEFRRARVTEQFFLVVVGNVERGDKGPEVRIITDPLNHLNVLPQGSVSLGGIRTAKALRYTFES